MTTAVAKRPTKPKPKRKTPAPVMCSERKKNGEPCGNHAMRGKTVCGTHSGAKNVGRPSLFTPEVRSKILQALTSGVGIDKAAAYANVSRTVVRNWLERGSQEAAAERTAEESEYVDFLEGVVRARAGVVTKLAARIQAAGDWRADAWLLERLAPDEFGTGPVQHEHSGTVSIEARLGGMQPVDVPIEIRDRIAALLEEARPIEGTAEDGP